MNKQSSLTNKNDPLSARIGLGIGLIVLSTGMFVSMDAIIKHCSELGYTTAQIIFFRNVFAFIPIGFLVIFNGGFHAIKTSRISAHIGRAFIGLSAMGCFFYAVRELPLSDLVAITFAAPLFMTALSGPLLGEKVGARRWSAVGLGFMGVIIMVQPSTHIQSATLIALCGTIFYALAMIAVRKMSRTETSTSIVFYFTLIGSIVSGGFLINNWIPVNLYGFAMLIFIGLIGGSAQIIMTYGIKVTPISILAPFEYSAILWACGFDILIWKIFPSTSTLWGALLVAITGLYILHRETHLNVRAKFSSRFSRIRVSSSERG